MLKISNQVSIPIVEIDLRAIRAQGAGGQHVNKVSSAIHLRFDIRASSLPEEYKEKLLMLKDQRISNDGCVVIKAQQFRSQDKNREEALERLRALVKSVAATRKTRKATKPTQGSQTRRLDGKHKRGQIKKLRSERTDS